MVSPCQSAGQDEQRCLHSITYSIHHNGDSFTSRMEIRLHHRFPSTFSLATRKWAVESSMITCQPLQATGINLIDWWSIGDTYRKYKMLKSWWHWRCFRHVDETHTQLASRAFSKVLITRMLQCILISLQIGSQTSWMTREEFSGLA